MTMTVKTKRQQQILEVIREDQHVTVSILSERFSVSEVTVRRDLSELNQAGSLRRVHGGAVAPELGAPEPPVFQRLREHEAAKDAIGQAAAKLVPEGSTLFLGSGSTTTYVARHLTDRRDLTVVTNALTVAQELALADGITVLVTGGVMRLSELSLVGHLTESAVRELHVDKVIIGMRAISLVEGLTNDYLPEVMTDRAIIEMADDLIVVADHTKLGKVGPAFVAPIQRIRTLVTDRGADAESLEKMKGLGIQIVVANCLRRNT
jgi:DeoR/GlpR family transcriptional regulator of sugar metabolism